MIWGMGPKTGTKTADFACESATSGFDAGGCGDYVMRS
jgi:hypothetical protein